jgi:hypothetical protein
MQEFFMKGRLLAGPWVGEFGWELLCWQGLVRKTSREYANTTVISRPGHQFLYADFCDRFVEFDPESWDVSMEQCKGAEFDLKGFLAEHEAFEHHLSGDFRMPFTFANGHWAGQNNEQFNIQEFVLLKPTKKFPKFDLIFHARNKPSDSYRSWNPKNWQALVDALYKDYSIALVGNHAAWGLSNTTDYRGISLEDLCNLICQSQLVVGPSSGPMHFASLCGKKHLVWSAPHNRIRYERDWNPFRPEVVFLDKFDWNPSVEALETLIREHVPLSM